MFSLPLKTFGIHGDRSAFGIAVCHRQARGLRGVSRLAGPFSRAPSEIRSNVMWKQDHEARSVALLAQWRSSRKTPHFIKVRTMRSSEKVAHDFRFTRLRIITERDLKHLRNKVLQTSQSPSEVIAQSKRQIEHACALMYAKHLAVGAMSIFASSGPCHPEPGSSV